MLSSSRIWNPAALPKERHELQEKTSRYITVGFFLHESSVSWSVQAWVIESSAVFRIVGVPISGITMVFLSWKAATYTFSQANVISSSIGIMIAILRLVLNSPNGTTVSTKKRRVNGLERLLTQWSKDFCVNPKPGLTWGCLKFDLGQHRFKIINLDKHWRF